jgi:hypothetical protein
MKGMKHLGAFSALRTGRRRLAAVTTMAMIAAVFTFVSAPVASADTIGPITFETSQDYVVGDINGQPFLGSLPNGKWSKTGPYDVEVVPVASFAAAAGYGFNAQALRISDAVTSGSFGDQTFTPGLADEAGEKNADNAGLSGGLRQPKFEMSFLIGTTKAIEQPGLHMSVSPDRGDGARMSYLRFEDQLDGVHVFFVDVTDPARVPDGDTFNESDIATIDRAQSHLIRLTIAFKNGPAQDVVKVFIDGDRKVTGTTWEDYYRYDSEQAPQGNKVPTVDKVLFRESGDAHTDNVGQGFLLDHVSLKSSGRKK